MTVGLTSSAWRVSVGGGTHLPRTGVCCLFTALCGFWGKLHGVLWLLLPKLLQGTQTGTPHKGTPLSAGTARAMLGAQGGDPSIPPGDVGMGLSISSPGPTGWSPLAPGQQSTPVCFNCKDRSNPARFLGAAHTLRDWWIWK